MAKGNKTVPVVLTANQVFGLLTKGKVVNSRAGMLTIETKVGRGTKVYHLPISASAALEEVADVEDKPKAKRGRKPKTEKTAAPKKRGRKPKKAEDEKPKKRRGRKPKSEAAATEKPKKRKKPGPKPRKKAEAVETKPKQKRRRRKKVEPVAEPEVVEVEEIEEEPVSAETDAPDWSEEDDGFDFFDED